MQVIVGLSKSTLDFGSVEDNSTHQYGLIQVVCDHGESEMILGMHLCTESLTCSSMHCVPLA